MKRWTVSILMVLTLSATAFAQPKGGEVQMARNSDILKLDGAEPASTVPARAKATPAKSAVDNHATVLRSHIKSLGTVGRFEIVQLKIRGLDGANLAGYFVYDSATGEIISGANSAAPGLGVAIVNGAASVGSSFLFGSNLKPDRQSINNSSGGNSNTAVGGAGGSSSASGGNSSSTATGGAGGASTATGGNSASDATSTATGTGTGNGGAGGTGTGGNGNGSFTPPGHINNPSDNH